MKFIFASLICLFTCSAFAQATSPNPNDRPKLVVGIVVDQMRSDYLYRFYNKFGNDGFRRLMNDGFHAKNTHYNYIPTVTGAGHSSIYTGATPAIHGVIENDWYDKNLKKKVNCVEDPTQTAVGGTANGAVSPWRLLSSTITDELKLMTNNKAKVIGIAMKDRSAVLPAGHNPDGAYWFDKSSGRIISSTYYMKELPLWVQNFNKKGLADIYLSQVWKPLLPVEQYTESGPDISPYEMKFYKGMAKSAFPYDLPALRAANGNYDLIRFTPFSNDFITEFTKEAITSEKLGKDAVTDFLCLSYSATDVLGHEVGPRSMELLDMYIRLDKNIADLLKKLDQEVGANNYVVFLTADHAISDVPQFHKDNKVPAGYFPREHVLANLKEYLNQYFPGKDLIEHMSDSEVFFNQEAFHSAPKAAGLEVFIVAELVGRFLMSTEGVANYYTEGVLRQGQFDDGGLKGMAIRGYHPKRSGDVVYTLEPGWLIRGSVAGSEHGSAYNYDTHVPLLFYGRGVKKGFTTRYHAITSIAPTLSMLMNITMPNSSSREPVTELFE